MGMLILIALCNGFHCQESVEVEKVSKLGVEVPKRSNHQVELVHKEDQVILNITRLKKGKITVDPTISIEINLRDGRKIKWRHANPAVEYVDGKFQLSDFPKPLPKAFFEQRAEDYVFRRYWFSDATPDNGFRQSFHLYLISGDKIVFHKKIEIIFNINP